MFYGFPALHCRDGGLKIAGEQFNHTANPEKVDGVNETEIAAMHAVAAPHLRITAKCVRAAACLYTVTADFGFIIDRHPDEPNVWLASACSGHGFKHSAATGEALAELAVEAKSRFDLAPFALARLTKTS